MRPLDVKICGLSTPAAVRAALEGGASHLGFIFFPRSPRNVSPDQARELAAPAAGLAATVAVTVDAGDEFLDAIVAALRPGLLQLHGDETPQRVRDVARRHGLPVMKAFPVREAADLEAVGPYRGVADRFLFDARPPAGAALPGGNGVSFDWGVLAGLDRDIDYMLSGGVNAANVAQAIRMTAAGGVDVSSGVESAPGVKDERLVGEFLAAARRAELERAKAPIGTTA